MDCLEAMTDFVDAFIAVVAATADRGPPKFATHIEQTFADSGTKKLSDVYKIDDFWTYLNTSFVKIVYNNTTDIAIANKVSVNPLPLDV